MQAERLPLCRDGVDRWADLRACVRCGEAERDDTVREALGFPAVALTLLDVSDRRRGRNRRRLGRGRSLRHRWAQHHTSMVTVRSDGLRGDFRDVHDSRRPGGCPRRVNRGVVTRRTWGLCKDPRPGVGWPVSRPVGERERGRGGRSPPHDEGPAPRPQRGHGARFADGTRVRVAIRPGLDGRAV